MKLLAILSFIFLVGCTTTVPVKRVFPDAPEVLKQQCEDLKSVRSEATTLSEIIKTVTENYTLYHECSMKVDMWIEWYNVQKRTFELQ